MIDRQPTFNFDVSFDYSLDVLSEEILDCLHNPESKCIFDIRGPVGGNTNVLIFTTDADDITRVKLFLNRIREGK